MVYGYARVSTAEQNLERQLVQLKEYVEDSRNIVVDKASGKNFDRRGYNALVGTDITAPMLRAGDVLIITSLDRLGRNYTEVREEWRRLTLVIGCEVRVLDMPLLDTSVSDSSLDGRFISELVLEILSYVSEKERINIRERQRQGIDAMRVVNGKRVSLKTGNPTGRPRVDFPSNWDEVYKRWRSGEITAVAARQELSLTHSTFYRLVRRYEAKIK